MSEAQATILAPDGGIARIKPSLKPPTAGNYFGWLDDDQEPVSISLAEISAVMRVPEWAEKHPMKGKYVLSLKNGSSTTITDAAVLDLLKRMNWK